jgi:CRISPR/Cas system-associated exonuclease Cas4 (RecB family)
VSTLVTAAPSPAIRRPSRGPEWVSKTDLTGFVRCPYAWWLLDRGDITVDDTVSEFHYRLMIEGSEFQDAVEATAAPIMIAPEELPSVLTSDKKLLATPTFENRRLHIYGRPDGVDAADGALIPIEIKSHKDVQRTDELELAFYWLVLEPSRTRKTEPRGLLFLRRDGAFEEVEAPIPAHRFDEVRRLLGEIRAARRDGVRLGDEFLSPSFHLTSQSLQRNIEDAPGRITRVLARLLLRLRADHLAKLSNIRGWLLDVVPPVAPSPWDAFVKLKIPDGRFLRITFDDNTQVAGTYYGSSFAVTSPQTAGIFLAEEWLLDQNGELVDPVGGRRVC